jgi:hypothetical protein
VSQSCPTFRKIADRSYTIVSDVDAAIAFFNICFRYAGPGKATDLWQHCWRHDGPSGRTMLILFKPHPPGSSPRLSLLGPRLDSVDALVEVEPAEVEPIEVT